MKPSVKNPTHKAFVCFPQMQELQSLSCKSLSQLCQQYGNQVSAALLSTKEKPFQKLIFDLPANAYFPSCFCHCQIFLSDKKVIGKFIYRHGSNESDEDIDGNFDRIRNGFIIKARIYKNNEPICGVFIKLIKAI